MGTVFTLFMVIIMLLCVLLIIIVMAQNPKGGGLSSTFGGTSSAQFGVQRTNDFMERATWILGSAIIVLILMNIVLTVKPSYVPAPNLPAKTQKVNSSAPQTAPVQKAPMAPVK